MDYPIAVYSRNTGVVRCSITSGYVDVAVSLNEASRPPCVPTLLPAVAYLPTVLPTVAHVPTVWPTVAYLPTVLPTVAYVPTVLPTVAYSRNACEVRFVIPRTRSRRGTSTSSSPSTRSHEK